jgi:hypothetical protein
MAQELLQNTTVTDELLSQFNRFTGRWHKLTTVRENAIKKVATVAREGVAEWWRFVDFKFYRSSLISPLTEDLKEFYSTHEFDKDREKLLQRSATNPYRRGLELAEAVEDGLGIGTLFLWGVVTEWPLEELRLRVPAYVVEQIQKDSPLAPDTRAAKLAELSHKTIGKLSSGGDAGVARRS